MFGIFKRKEKEQSATVEEPLVWGQPSQRKLTKEEAAREAAEQKLIEEKSKERRDMYRLAGRERIFSDLEGRHLVVRTEDNTGPKASPHHPPLQITAFWGARELGWVKVEIGADSSLRQLEARIDPTYKERGIAAEILRELENIARQKKLSRIYCTGVTDNEWNTDLLTQSGYTPQGNELVKAL